MSPVDNINYQMSKINFERPFAKHNKHRDLNLFSSPDMKVAEKIKIKKANGYFPLHQIGESANYIKNTPLLKSEVTSQGDLNHIMFPIGSPHKNTKLESIDG